MARAPRSSYGDTPAIPVLVDGTATPPAAQSKRVAAAPPVRGAEVRTKLLNLPPEIVLIILEWLLRIGMMTLFCTVPAVCKRLRALCARVHGKLCLEGCPRSDLVRVLSTAVRLFPHVTGLWQSTRFPLHMACEAGRAPLARRLLSERPDAIAQLDDARDTPLLTACRNGHTRLAIELIERGADVNHKGPLWIAAAAGEFDLAEALIRGGANVNHQQRDGSSALYYACGQAQLSVAELLLASGAQVNLNDFGGRTPLFEACQRGHIDLVRLLLSHGADKHRRSGDGDTPLSIARLGGHTRIVELLSQ